MATENQNLLSLDVDGNGLIKANRDGLLIYGYLNVKDIPIPALMDQLASNLADPNGTRNTGSEIASYLSQGLTTMLDVDGNGRVEANRDGLLIYGYLNVRDIPIPALMEQLASNLADPDGTPTTGSARKTFLDCFLSPSDATAVWINPSDGFWDEPDNWETGQLPTIDDDVFIGVPGDVTITHRSGTTQINSLTTTEKIDLTGGTLDLVTMTVIHLP